MDMENNHNNQTQSKSQNLTYLPLEQLTDEQISELMTRLETIKKQKAEKTAPISAPAPDDAEQTKVMEIPVPPSHGNASTIAETGTEQNAEPVSEPVSSPVTAQSAPAKAHSAQKQNASASSSTDPTLIFPDPSCFDELGDAPDPGAPYEIPDEPRPSSTGGEDDPYDTRPLSSDDMDEETIAVYRDLVRKRRKQRRLILSLAAVVGVLILVIVVFAGYLNLYKPTLDDDLPSFMTGSDDPATTDEILTGDITSPTDDDVPAPVVNDTYARREDVYNFLVLGIDRAANLSDVIMIVSYDVKNGDISVLSLPRDTYINVGSNYHKLNAYFSASYNRSRETGTERYRDAIESMSEFIENGLCIKLDRYVCVDTAGFREIIDAIGGVDMEVPFDMYYEDPEQDLYIDLKAGYQHLTGAQAEQFVRYRSGYLNGDIGRISAQKLFLTALVNQIKNSFNASTLVSIAKTAIEYVTTDLTVAEIGYFAKYALSVDLDKISFTTLPGGGVVNPDSGASYYVMYAENVRQIVNERFNVYTREITEEVFLSNAKKFTSTESYIATVFSSYIDDAGTVTAGEIESGDLDIPIR